MAQAQCPCLYQAEPLPSLETWKCVHASYQPGLVKIVTTRWAIFSRINKWLRRPPPSLEDCNLRISVAVMQRMYISALKVEIAQLGLKLRFVANPEDGDDHSSDKSLSDAAKALPRLLERYTQAVRDYDYMITSSQRPLDAFIISPENALDSTIIDHAKMQHNFDCLRKLCPPLPDHGKAKRQIPHDALDTGPWEVRKEGIAAPSGGTRSANTKSVLRAAFWSRLGAALIGAVFLVGPMWLLVLKRDLFVHLGATTGFIAGFGLVVALFVEKPDQVFAGTLAYAAVLMVFIGVMMDSSS